ncbi:MAG: hypothetical protein ABR556_13235 [Pyrinomonadaceae bacterium]
MDKVNTDTRAVRASRGQPAWAVLASDAKLDVAVAPDSIQIAALG